MLISSQKSIFLGSISAFDQLLTDFGVSRFGTLNLSVQAQILEAAICQWSKESFKYLKFFRERPWNFTKNAL